MANDLLIYGKTYDLWREGRHIGQAVWTDDPNLGDAFLVEIGANEFEVYKADHWEFAT